MFWTVPLPILQAGGKPVWHKLLLCVQWKSPDYEQRNCPKHVEFYSKNKFEKSVHVVGFIIRIYHDARSPERHSALAHIANCDRITQLQNRLAADQSSVKI